MYNTYFRTEIEHDTEQSIEQNKDRKANQVILLLSLIIAALITGMAAYRTDLTVQAKTQEHLAEEVLRFHVLANSDSENDQALKMQVKEAVIAYLEQNLPKEADGDATKEWVRVHTDELEQLSREIVAKEGYEYPVSAAVTTCYFPEKSYGDVTFPAGNYTALRVEIGSAKGQNWWCVLYPNLCFMDAVNAVVPEEGKQQLKQVLTEEEHEQVTATTDFEIKWYLPEFLEKYTKDKNQEKL